MRSNSCSKLVMALLFLLTGVGSAVGAIPNEEREALIALYKSTDGDSWFQNYGWLGPPGTEGRWYGVTVQYNRVQLLHLSNNNLVGSIPPELGNLGGMEINLSNNRLSGPIPPELSSNPGGLLFLDLHSNQLSGPIPPELAQTFLLHRLDLHNNKLSGSIPSELGNMGFLMMLNLSNNELSGAIPPELGKTPKLGGLGLSNNKLSGTVPPELGNLTNLRKDNCDFRDNALYTNDSSLRDFLNSKQIGGDWEGTQTIAPTDVTVDAPTGDSIRVSWTPIRFTEFGGGYRVFYSTSSGGPYTLFGMTANKNATFLDVTGLNPGTTYYFVVQTVTHPHDLNNNTIESEFSEEVSRSLQP
jgi:hypothetical protein